MHTYVATVYSAWLGQLSISGLENYVEVNQTRDTFDSYASSTLERHKIQIYAYVQKVCYYTAFS